MRKRRRLLTVSAVLLLIAAGHFLVMQNAGDIEPAIIRGWRLFLTAVLSLFLALGNNAARWLTVILCGLGAIGGVFAVAILAATGALPPGNGHVLVWFGAATAVNAYISWFLAFSSGVSREIRRISEKTL